MAQVTGFHWLHVCRVAALVRPGAKRTIVIVPGAMADAQGWVPFAAALRTSLSIAIVNRRGRAPSEELPPDSTVPYEVDNVEEVLSHLQGPFTRDLDGAVALIMTDGKRRSNRASHRSPQESSLGIPEAARRSGSNRIVGPKRV
ncbi:MAG TPA: hypothetical protein VES20_20510 [Bryobacteraceae bacterium]|nr:hypothetical protein [Bryobacteraceae bacterium]